MIGFEGEPPDRLLKQDWERINKLGLIPGVKTPGDYRERVADGMRTAYSLIEANEDPIPSISLIRKLHYHSFVNVHPWAGDFRPLGHEVMVGNMASVDSKDIKKELSTLTKEMRAEPFFGAHEYVAEVVAFYHSSFEAIHPFLDGNGRVGRMIMHRQMKLGLGLKQEASLVRSQYLGALKHAQQTGELAPFGKLLMRAARTPQISKGLEIG